MVWKLKNWRHSDKSDKSMDLVKSTQSEDLPKDLQGNSKDCTLKHVDFMMRWMNRVENRGDWPDTDLSQICVQIYVVSLRDPALRNTICSDSGTNRDCVKGNLSKCHTDTQTK